MNNGIYFLEKYPLGQCYKRCSHYIYECIDWDSISQEVGANNTTHFDVSDSINIFQHLELDRGFRLICFVTHEYHGLWGRVAAVPKNAKDCCDIRSVSKNVGKRMLILPETAVPPMEVIYNRGTAESYFEALLCSQLLSAIPYAYHQRNVFDKIIQEKPEDFDEKWDSHVDISDWRPRVIVDGADGCEIIACKYHFESVIGGADGRSRIYLSRYSFSNDIKWFHMMEALTDRTKNRLYPARFDDSKRFSEQKRCSVSSETSILIARQKRGI